MWLVLSGNVEKSMDLWKWKFATEEGEQLSKEFCIRFSRSTPGHWTIATSEFDEQASLDEVNRACKMAANETFITIAATLENEEQVTNNLETLMEFVSKLHSITCVVQNDYDSEAASNRLTGVNVFTVVGVNPSNKEWEVLLI